MEPGVQKNEVTKEMVPVFKHVAAYRTGGGFTWARCTDAGSSRAIDWEVSLRIHNAHGSANYMDGQIIYDAKLSMVTLTQHRDKARFEGADMTMSKVIIRAY